MSFRMDKSKIAFKKRAHRPWQSNLLTDTTEENLAVLDVSPIVQDKQYELLQKQLESSLEIKKQEQQNLAESLVKLDDHRITFGGFLKPKDILLVTEHESLKKAAHLMNEIKAKEQEILEVTQHLKITQASDIAERAEAARKAEEKARLAAEEKAIYALKQAHQAVEHIKQTEERALILEQTKLKLEQELQALEEKLRLTVQGYEGKLLQATQEIGLLNEKAETSHGKETKLNYQLKVLSQSLNDEKDAKKRLSEKTQTQINDLEQQLRNQITLTEEERNLKLLAENELQVIRDETKALKQTMQNEKHLLTDELTQARQFSVELQEKIETIKFEKEEMHGQLQNIHAHLMSSQSQQNKMIELISLERNLRVLFEEKLKNTLIQMEKSELRRRAESEARRLAEEKTKHTIEQAGKAMIQLLHNTPVTDKVTESTAEI